jgi:hypothetical protein
MGEGGRGGKRGEKGEILCNKRKAVSTVDSCDKIVESYITHTISGHLFFIGKQKTYVHFVQRRHAVFKCFTTVKIEEDALFIFKYYLCSFAMSSSFVHSACVYNERII